MSALTDEQFRTLARLGAARRLAELEEEAAAIRREFPETGKSHHPVSRDTLPRERASDRPPVRRSKARWRMTAEQRQDVSERMKRYWAGRRKGSQKGHGTR